MAFAKAIPDHPSTGALPRTFRGSYPIHRNSCAIKLFNGSI